MALSQTNRNAEVFIDKQVLKEARRAAAIRAQNLSAVCRIAVTYATSEPIAQTQARRGGGDRRRYRFAVEGTLWKQAKARVAAVGGNMSAYMEEALRLYAEQGNVRQNGARTLIKTEDGS